MTPDKWDDLIDTAAREGRTSLNLSRRRLTSLPARIWSLRHLRVLDLSDNQLTSLPPEIGGLSALAVLYLSNNQLTSLPPEIGELPALTELYLSKNQLTSLPPEIGKLRALSVLSASDNQLTSLTPEIGELHAITRLFVTSNRLRSLPHEIGQLSALKVLHLSKNKLTSLPPEIGELRALTVLSVSHNMLRSLPPEIGKLRRPSIDLSDNPLDDATAAAYEEGTAKFLNYLSMTARSHVALNEAKLILVGEGGVGKSSLLSALLDEPWVEGRATTHGIEIKTTFVTDPGTNTKIALNGWDFGGQTVSRPTHQLFFSAPAVYLVVWKPREGSEQGLVRYWIQLILRREPNAKILVVATHGGPGERQAHLDREELWGLFGRESVVDFFHVESKPSEATGERRGIGSLRDAIARVAAALPDVGRPVPTLWKEARDALSRTQAAYLSLDDVFEHCRNVGLSRDEAELFVTLSHRRGHLIHYEHDPLLRDLVVLRPDWLATAISLVLDDEQTEARHGLVRFDQLARIWNADTREAELRYPPHLHLAFLRLMERFDISYRVAVLREDPIHGPTSLIAQLVSSTRPEATHVWAETAGPGEEERAQICRVVEKATGVPASAEGLFYQLIVRLHRYSLGRVRYEESIHWQRGLLVDDDYNGRAFLEHVGTSIRITVRAAYPECFLSVLTSEVKWLVESFWDGLRCEVTVPCVAPCSREAPGSGLYEVEKLVDSKKKGRPEYPCPLCGAWQHIDSLLRNAPVAHKQPVTVLVEHIAMARADIERSHVDVSAGINAIRAAIERSQSLASAHNEAAIGRFDSVDAGMQRLMSQMDEAFARLLQTFVDEARDGPRLFSVVPVEPGFFDAPTWLKSRFRLVLWCEHSRRSLPAINGDEDSRGVYDLEFTRDWLVRAAPFLKLLSGTLSVTLPVVAAATKLALSETLYKDMEKQLDLGQKLAESAIKAGELAKTELMHSDSDEFESGRVTAHGGTLRQLHALLRERDPSFGDLVRVQNKRGNFLWVHPMFEWLY